MYSQVIFVKKNTSLNALNIKIMMNIETQLKLKKLFEPRDYQKPLCDALENKKFNRLIAIWPRRAGKDVCAFNLMLRQALKKTGVYYYIFPTYSQAKKVIWDSIVDSQTGMRFLDYIPKILVKSSNSTEMKITLLNGSLIQLIGSDNIDSLMGTNPIGIVFSEYALQDPRAYQYLRPILLANGGWAMFISTPRGKNNLYELYQIAINNPENWFVSKLSVLDTGHISIHEIQKEVAEGLISEDLAQQEYYTSFEMGVEGAYYAKYIDRMRIKGQIGVVPYESSFKVNTAWDLGVRDMCVIIFWQQIGQTVRIFDYYEKSKEGLEHYVNVLESKPYSYGKHFAPHDIAVQEFGSGLTRLEKARQLGLKFETYTDRYNQRYSAVPNVSIMDGIETCRSSFGKIWIDEKNCAPLIKALENYRQEYDPKKQVYKSQPLHNIWSHAADAFRYLCLSLPKAKDSLSAEELDARYRRAMLGNQGDLPKFFQDGNR